MSLTIGSGNPRKKYIALRGRAYYNKTIRNEKRPRRRERESVMRSFRLTNEEIQSLAARHQTPFLVISLAQVEENYRFFRRHLPRVNVYYAMKANPASRILSLLDSLGAGFDTASAGEMETLAAMGVPPVRMIYANPVKTPDGLRTAARLGVVRMTFDDADEIEKMVSAVPHAEALVRVRIHNEKALVDLNAKFGVNQEEALPLLRRARDAGLTPKGVCFHVGSQALSTEAYEEALLFCRRIFDEAEADGMKLSMLDIGGGFPIPLAGRETPDAEQIMQRISRQLDRLFPETEIWAEPGRFLCGTAVNLVTSVIGVKKRGEESWYTIDEGVYGTLSGAIYDHWTYSFEAVRSGEAKPSTVLGPSCDSIDFVGRGVMLPELKTGDLVLVPDCGAYTSASATTFNGFARAKAFYFEDVAADLASRREMIA